MKNIQFKNGSINLVEFNVEEAKISFGKLSEYNKNIIAGYVKKDKICNIIQTLVIATVIVSSIIHIFINRSPAWNIILEIIPIMFVFGIISRGFFNMQINKYSTDTNYLERIAGYEFLLSLENVEEKTLEMVNFTPYEKGLRIVYTIPGEEPQWKAFTFDIKDGVEYPVDCFDFVHSNFLRAAKI